MSERYLISHAARLSLLLLMAKCTKADEPRRISATADAGSEIIAGPREILVTASGETLASGGFDFPPGGPETPYFIDGWSMHFDKLLVTFDNVTIYDGPDTSPSDQSQVGLPVARATGPFAVDLHRRGPLVGKSGSDSAVPIAKIPSRDLRGDEPFELDTKYAFGFDVVTASEGAVRVNFPADDPDYADMVRSGYSTLYVGTATFEGVTCTPPLGSNATLDSLPKVIQLRLGFRTPRRYVNCENPDLGTAPGGARNPRGFFVLQNEATVAQLTVHADHPFWDANEEDAPLRADLFAFVAGRKADAGAPVVTLEDLRGVPFLPVTIAGTPLPRRTCEPAPPQPAAELSYDPKGASYTDIYEFISDRQSTQGHLNADGLCAVRPLP